MASSEPILGTVVADLREFWDVALANLTREVLAANYVWREKKKREGGESSVSSPTGIKYRKQGFNVREAEESLRAAANA
jgi:hypothetical protein